MPIRLRESASKVAKLVLRLRELKEITPEAADDQGSSDRRRSNSTKCSVPGAAESSAKLFAVSDDQDTTTSHSRSNLGWAKVNKLQSRLLFLLQAAMVVFAIGGLYFVWHQYGFFWAFAFLMFGFPIMGGISVAVLSVLLPKEDQRRGTEVLARIVDIPSVPKTSSGVDQGNLTGRDGEQVKHKRMKVAQIR